MMRVVFWSTAAAGCAGVALYSLIGSGWAELLAGLFWGWAALDCSVSAVLRARERRQRHWRSLNLRDPRIDPDQRSRLHGLPSHDGSLGRT